MRPLRHLLPLIAALGALYAASGPAEPAHSFSCPVAGAALTDVRDTAAGLDGGAPVRVPSALHVDDNPPKPKQPDVASGVQRRLVGRVDARRATRTQPPSRQTTYLVTRRLRV